MASEIEILGSRFGLFLSNKQIMDRIKLLAMRIREDYLEKFPLFLVVLKGAYPFAKDLIQAAGIPCSVSFIQLSSYEGFMSGESVQIRIPLTDSIEGREVIVVEDILESGKTLAEALPALQKQKPASLKVCTLLRKPHLLRFQVEIAYNGFDIPDAFVVGYGLDYREQGRELADIYKLTTSGST